MLGQRGKDWEVVTEAGQGSERATTSAAAARELGRVSVGEGQEGMNVDEFLEGGGK